VNLNPREQHERIRSKEVAACRLARVFVRSKGHLASFRELLFMTPVVKHLLCQFNDLGIFAALSEWVTNVLQELSLLATSSKPLRTSRFICTALRRGVSDGTSTEDVDVCRRKDSRFSRATGR